MSRKHRREQIKTVDDIKQNEPTPVEDLSVAVVSESVNPATEEFIPKHRRCPLCWTGQKGVGVQYSAYPLKKTKYFKCKNCAHTWSAVVFPHVQEFNDRLPDDISER